MTGLEGLGLIMLIVMIGVIFIGFPISFTLLILALVFGYAGLGQMVFDLAYLQTIGLMKMEELAAVPLFIFMGYLTEQAGLMERLFRAFRDLLAPVRGALYLGVILTATVFAMATGIVGAAVTVLGIMAAPIMIKAGYDSRMAAGSIAAGGTLGILVPPSVMLIVMGPVLGVSVADLYAAAFGPGFLLAGMYIVVHHGAQLPQSQARSAGAAGRAAHVLGHRDQGDVLRHGSARHADHLHPGLDPDGAGHADRSRLRRLFRRVRARRSPIAGSPSPASRTPASAP